MKNVRVALFSLVLAACSSGQPTVFRIAVDMRPVSPVADGNCYKGGTAPTNTPISTNLRTEEQWVIWDGAAPDGTARQYLDMGAQSFTLGQSPTIAFAGDIETNQTGAFIASLETKSAAGDTLTTRDTSMTVKFTDEGATPTGTIDLMSQYNCPGSNGVDCPDEQFVADPRTCSATLTFIARRIDASRIEGFSTTGTGATGGVTPTTGGTDNTSFGSNP